MAAAVRRLSPRARRSALAYLSDLFAEEEEVSA